MEKGRKEKKAKAVWPGFAAGALLSAGVYVSGLLLLGLLLTKGSISERNVFPERRFAGGAENGLEGRRTPDGRFVRAASSGGGSSGLAGRHRLAGPGWDIATVRPVRRSGGNAAERTPPPETKIVGFCKKSLKVGACAGFADRRDSPGRRRRKRADIVRSPAASPQIWIFLCKKWELHHGRFVKNFVGNAEKTGFHRNFLAKRGKFL